MSEGRLRGSRARWALVFVAAAAAAFLMGAYRQTMSDAEAVHYSLNFPARGYAAGGIGARGADGHLIVNLGATGILKRWLQPSVVNLSSHWVRNVGDVPRRVRFEAEGVPFPLQWESNERTWDPETRTIGRTIAPGESVTVDWYVTVPDPLPARDITMDARIVVYDADSGARLTALPIRFVPSAAAAKRAGDCCAP